MSWNNRVVWSEGMFIGTQHFQQHDRYLENLIDARSRPLSAGAWGFSELLIDQGLLAQGKLAIVSARGLLPDGTPFNIPQDDLAPSPLNIDDSLRDGLVYLALPLKRAGARDTVDDGEALGAARYVSQVREVRDDNAPFENRAPVAVGSRALRLLTAQERHQRLRRYRPGTHQGKTRRPCAGPRRHLHPAGTRRGRQQTADGVSQRTARPAAPARRSPGRARGRFGRGRRVGDCRLHAVATGQPCPAADPAPQPTEPAAPGAVVQ